MSTVPFTPADADVRARIRTSLDECLIVEAAAGTGKTTELVARIVSVLASGRATAASLVAVTFTRKAAGELKLRIRQELDRARQNARGAELAHLEEALAHLEEARIGTIHSFCAELLRERPVEAQVDPGFEDLSEAEAPRVYAAAFREWIEAKLADPTPALRRILARPAVDGSSPVDALRRAGWRFLDYRDFRARWQRRPYGREAAIDALVLRVCSVADSSDRAIDRRDDLYRALNPARTLALWIRRAERAGGRDYDTLEGLLLKLRADLKRFRNTGRAKLYGSGLPRAEVKQAREDLIRGLDEFDVQAGADLAALLQADALELAVRYEDHKRRAGKLDFVDLLVRARDLVRGDAEVRHFLQRRFTHIFVDEFQDTDPLQAEILVLLAARDPDATDWLAAEPIPGKLFLVGDPKQSIYRFRRAEVLLYREVREALAARGVAVVQLTTSHRAVAPIQRAINAAFAPAMTGDAATGQPDYIPLAPRRVALPDQPALVALSVPRPYGERSITRTAIETCLPDAIAAFVEWLIGESGWRVTEPERPDEPVAVEPRHVAVLFRKLFNRYTGEDATHALVRALEARGIPHLLLGGRSFNEREEIDMLRAALNAIEWPDDELAVYATLRGALFAIADHVLLRYRQASGGRLHPFRPAPQAGDPDFAPVAEALAVLAELHRRRNRTPAVSTLSALLETTRTQAGLAMRFGGRQALTNVHRLLDLARAYEASGGESFRGFVEFAGERIDEGEAGAAPVLESGAEGVRILSVHGAKGLEFPVVILADLCTKAALVTAERTIDARRNLCAQRLLGCTPWELHDHAAEETARDEAEGLRVAYVAATRARDVLVVPAVADEPREGWFAALNRAIYPDRNARRNVQPAPGCPPFGNDTVLDRTVAADVLRPGRHEFDGYDVVWWDPACLRLGVPPSYGLRDEALLRDGPDAPASISAYEAWKAERAAAVEAGLRPQYELFTPAEASDSPPGFDARLELIEAPTRERPSGRRFGTLVHAVLRDAAFDADTAALGRIARLHARLFGAPDEEVEASVRVAQTALASTILERARRAARVHRELPLTLRLDGGRVLEGVADLAFEETGEWVIVDFKTDLELPVARYRRQLEWYAYALARITGRPARACLLSL